MKWIKRFLSEQVCKMFVNFDILLKSVSHSTEINRFKITETDQKIKTFENKLNQMAQKIRQIESVSI